MSQYGSGPQYTSPQYTQQSQANVPPPPPQAPMAPQVTTHITHQVVTVQQPLSVGVAYLLWFFLGGLGIHKFYLRNTNMGIVYLLLGLVGWGTFAFIIGIPMVVVLGVLLIIDLFTIPNQVDTANRMAQPLMY